MNTNVPVEGEPAPIIPDGSELPPPIDSLLICFVMMARFHHTPIDMAQIKHQFIANDFMTCNELLIAAKSLKLHARMWHTKHSQKANFAKLPLPAICQDQHGKFFVLAKIDEKAIDEGNEFKQFLIQYPDQVASQYLSLNEFVERWNGQAILIASQHSLIGNLAKFDFSWFIPAVVKYRKLLLEVLVASLVIQCFALITPLFFQVVMDKVLVHKGLMTLNVIAVGLAVVVTFEVLLTTLRTYIFSHTTSRIDVELGAKLFRHLLALPSKYFQARRVGDSVARVRELENIRSFLTGNAITLVLDLLFSVIFLGVMFYYSSTLALVVLISLPGYVILSVLLTPLLRQKLNEKFQRGAENQSFLVESVSAVDTIKSLSVEPHWIREWDKQLANYVKSSFKASNLNNLANAGVTLISKAVTVATMWLGANLVIENKITVGQLIAFNMLAGNVSGPVIRLAQLWSNWQQTGIAIERLGDILNTPTETQGNKPNLPALQGNIVFDQIAFRYRSDGSNILKNISFTIQAGEVIGIVGRSGSGKSTLTKLIQRLFVAEQGRILLDQIDINLVDVSSLRRQIGVVLQDNILFSRSIRDNICVTDPNASMENIIYAAQLAGAHEFITELPEGYDTLVGEHGSGLSGGQRQRIAIARALLTNPKILIFDEATSALDYESEAIIQKNMQAICRGRTVLIITHRLSTVSHAHRIFVMEKGELIESGTPDELLAIEHGYFRKLTALQKVGG